MSRIAYVNGSYLPHSLARVHVEDRGFQFSDGVYEVIPVYEGRLINLEWHMQRLKHSLHEMRIGWPVTPKVLHAILEQLLQRNRIDDGGMIYLQITRGVAPRNHAFPLMKRKPTLVLTARRMDMAARAAVAATGVQVISLIDTRWARRDIKTVSLLPNILAKQKAAEAGAAEALFVSEDGPDGYVTEGASSSFWIVDKAGVLLTHPLGHEILPGVTRRAVLALAQEMGVKTLERRFTLAEAKAAAEAFLTSAMNFVMPVTKIDAQIIANGSPGAISLALRRAYIAKLQQK